MPFDTYRAWPAINASLLHGYARSPQHARHEQLHGRPDSAQMALGRAVHAALLEPEVFGATYVSKWRKTGPGSREVNASIRAAIARRGQVELAEEEFAEIGGMRRAVLAHPLAGPLVEEACGREVSALWLDPETGAPCKARFDLLNETLGPPLVVADVKTARSASARSFQRDVVDYGYYAAAAWYLGGLAALQPGHDRRWVWIAVESTEPYAVACYEPDEGLLLRGWEECRRLLALHLECERTQTWPGYDGLQTITAPRWL